MSTASSRPRRPGPARGPAKVILMPTPRVVRRRRAIRATMGMLAVGLIGAILARLYVSRTMPLTPEEVAGLTVHEAEIMDLVNDERARAGLKPLNFSPRMAVMARGHSYDMAIRRYFARNSPEGITPADRLRGVGIESREPAENIYMDDVRDADGLPQRTLKAWLASAEDRTNLLSPAFAESGVGEPVLSTFERFGAAGRSRLRWRPPRWRPDARCWD
jgi:hypothetical protein